MTFLVAGLGVVAIVVVMGPLLRGKWLQSHEIPVKPSLDGLEDVVLELVPGSTGKPKSEEMR
jgi:hypothetical protein